LAREAKERIKKFDYAKKFLLEKPIVNSDLAEVLTNLEQRIYLAENERSKLAMEHEVAKRELTRVTEQRNELFSALGQYSTMRGQLIALAIQTHRRIKLRIERLSLPRPRRAATLRIPDLEGTDTEKLVAIAKNYDAQHLTTAVRRSLHRSLAYVTLKASYKSLTYVLKQTYKTARFFKRKLRR